ncbi:3-hydroxyacyl-CoA dehydrogenase [Aquabacterium sp.]|uniref:3-hydroxyacyl-CoA dehydrogenase n=1 Tax=Aquabacterium sp. TaxID=1872578 RepID=UPI0027B8CB03|nr:3-hydroxyacyl-CoA dehydrogenase [Aquabacterium sp.]
MVVNPVQSVGAVGVVGAGAMGRGIAQVCAVGGLAVKLYDSSAEAVGRALQAVRDDLMVAVTRSKMSQADADQALARIKMASALSDLQGCDLVVEAIIEQLEAKQKLFRSLELVVTPQCILATNTSSLSVTAIASVCTHPERVVGWHFFNPVPRMKVVEIIQAPRTSDDVVQQVVSLSQKVGHRGVVTSDSPGFVVNHAGRAFVTEGLKLLAERSASHQELDAILKACAGFRMGPFELLDLTGLDVSVPVMESIHAQYFGDDRYRPVALARTRMTAGLLGRKTGQGFYDYNSPPKALAVAPALVQLETVKVWWPIEGPAAMPDAMLPNLPVEGLCQSPEEADVILLFPIARDLSSTVVSLGLDASKAVAVDPTFGSASGVTLMVSPATTRHALNATQALFASKSVKTFVIADSPGYVAPRVVACIVNLVCEMAQQGVATPADIDAAVRLGLGYPCGPFEWGDRIGANRVLHIMQELFATFGDQRYRPAPWLVRRAELGLSLSAPDRQI